MLNSVLFSMIQLTLICLVRYLSRLYLERKTTELPLNKLSYHLNNVSMVFQKLSSDPSLKVVFESKDAVSFARILEACVCQSDLYDLNILCKGWIDIWQITVWRQPHKNWFQRLKIHGFH